MRVLADMRNQLSLPKPEDGEGFDRIYTLPESRQPLNGEWTDGDVQSVLRSIEEEGMIESVPRRIVETRSPARFPLRGRGVDHQGRGGYRGRADYRGRGIGYIPRGGAYRGPGEGGSYSGSYGSAPGPYPVPSGSSATRWQQQPVDTRLDRLQSTPDTNRLDAYPRA